MSPTPFSLLCAILLTLPLAIVFTITTPPTTKTGGATTLPTPTPTSTTINKSYLDPLVTLPPNQQKPFNKTTSILPPAPVQLQNDEDDNSLFRLASRVNPYPNSPRKLAFLFLTTTSLPLAPLWELYFNQTSKNLYNVYIHADPTSHYDAPFSGVFYNRSIPSKPTQRHSPTLIAAHRRLLAQALLDDPANYMFALVSSSCIPIHSFSFAYKYLIRSRKSFIEILKNEKGTYGRWVARGEDAMLPEVKLESFRIGSQFSVLTRRHARIIVSDTRIWSKFNQPCVKEHLNKCYPEENYFPTLISMVDPRGSVPATLTHVDWNGRHDGHPHTYHAPDVGPELIMSLRNDKPRYGDDGMNGSEPKRQATFLFARKFGGDSVVRLLEIGNDVIVED